jgi:K+-transporting ATPase KdpF subunit
MNTTILIETIKPIMNITTGYILGAIVALLIFAYLIYTLIKPEKF